MFDGSCNVSRRCQKLGKAQCFLKVGDVAVSMLSLDLTLFFLHTVALAAIPLLISRQKKRKFRHTKEDDYYDDY